jgi:hypothetical protein
MGLDYFEDSIDAQASHPGDPFCLKLRIPDADVRVKAAGRGCHGVCWHQGSGLKAIILKVCHHAIAHGVQEFF